MGQHTKFWYLSNMKAKAAQEQTILRLHWEWPELLILTYCKFGNFCVDFIFAKLRIMQSFVKIKPSQNGKITLSVIDICKYCLNREVFTSLMCLLMQFAKITFSRKFPNLQYTKYECRDNSVSNLWEREKSNSPTSKDNWRHRYVKMTSLSYMSHPSIFSIFWEPFSFK